MSLGIFIFITQYSSFAAAALAKADIRSTGTELSLTGTIFFTDTSEGLHVMAELKGLPPGKHGFHIHENASCADAGKAAGGHYNPAGAPHGLLTKDGLQHAHAGDFGNVESDKNGNAKLELTLPGLSIEGGQYNVAGHAVILHEKEDDFGQPTGNAGGRIGCGLIEMSE